MAEFTAALMDEAAARRLPLWRTGRSDDPDKTYYIQAERPNGAVLLLDFSQEDPS